MKRASLVNGAAAVAVLLCNAGHASAQSASPYTLSIQGLVLQRDDIGDAQFTGPDNLGDPFFAFGAKNLDPDWSGGARITIDGFKFWGNRVQFSAFFAGDFEASGTVFDVTESGTNASYDDDAHLNPGADVDTSDSDDLYALKVEHRTRLAGTETVTSLPLGSGGLTFLYGTRSFYLDEELRSAAFDEQDDFNGLDDGINRVRIKSKNLLYGAQIGVNWLAPLGSGVMFDGTLRGGLMANFIDVKRRFTDDGDATNALSNKLDDTAFAQFVEFRPQLTFEISPGVSLTAGGSLLYINGLSLATEYFETVTDNDDKRVHDDGDALFYGGTLGLTFALN